MIRRSEALAAIILVCLTGLVACDPDAERAQEEQAEPEMEYPDPAPNVPHESPWGADPDDPGVRLDTAAVEEDQEGAERDR